MKTYRKYKVNSFINSLILMKTLKEQSFHRNKLGKVNHFVINEEGEWINILSFKGTLLLEKTNEIPKSISEIEDLCTFVQDVTVNEKLIDKQEEFSKHLLLIMN